MKRVLLLWMGLPAMAMAQLPLETAEAAFRLAGAGYSTEAVVEAGRESILASQVAGRILVLDVDAGDRVRRGQVLVRVDDSEARNSLAGNQAAVSQARANLANAKAQHERTQQLVNRKFMSPATLDKAEAEYRAAEAQLEAARAGVAQSSTIRSFATIVSPFNGLVSERMAQKGEMASLGKPLLRVFDPATLRIVATISQEKLDEVRRAGRVAVELPAIGKTVDSAAITVLPSADSRAHTSQVRIDLPQGLAGLYPGMFARVSFEMNGQRRLIVPARAIARRSEVTGVFVVKGDQVRFRQVRIGRETPEDIEVLAGLEAAERVALDPVKAGIHVRSKPRHE